MLAVFTSEHFFEEEIELIHYLFENGLELLHVRKPGCTKEDLLQKFITKIKPIYLKRLVIHQHVELITKYNLRGIHFTGKFLSHTPKDQILAMIKAAKSKNISVSTSVHSLSEITDISSAYNYVFLSPVFDSISKQGYKSKLDTFVTLKEIKKSSLKILALGGVSPENIHICKDLGFDGLGILGYLWKDLDHFKENFVTLKNVYHNLY